LLNTYEPASTPTVVERAIVVERGAPELRPAKNRCYTGVKHAYSISDVDVSSGEGPEKARIDLRPTRAFIEDIDATWREYGFNSRSEFLRHVAWNAVNHPDFSREGWGEIAASEHDLRSGGAELVSREDVQAMMDRDADEK